MVYSPFLVVSSLENSLVSSCSVFVECLFIAWVVVRIVGLIFLICATVFSLLLLLFFYIVFALFVSVCEVLFWDLLFATTQVAFSSASFYDCIEFSVTI